MEASKRSSITTWTRGRCRDRVAAFCNTCHSARTERKSRRNKLGSRKRRRNRSPKFSGHYGTRVPLLLIQLLCRPHKQLSTRVHLIRKILLSPQIIPFPTPIDHQIMSLVYYSVGRASVPQRLTCWYVQYGHIRGSDSHVRRPHLRSPVGGQTRAAAAAARST